MHRPLAVPGSERGRWAAGSGRARVETGDPAAAEHEVRHMDAGGDGEGVGGAALAGAEDQADQHLELVEGGEAVGAADAEPEAGFVGAALASVRALLQGNTHLQAVAEDDHLAAGQTAPGAARAPGR